MEGYNKSAHAVYRCEYHFVWIPKYRFHVLVQEVKHRLKEILVELCSWQEIRILEGAVVLRSRSHVPLSSSAPVACSSNEDSEGEKCRKIA